MSFSKLKKFIIVAASVIFVCLVAAWLVMRYFLYSYTPAPASYPVITEKERADHEQLTKEWEKAQNKKELEK